MKLQTLEEVEKSVGGRPPRKKGHKSERLTFYLPLKEAEQLREIAESTDQTVSQILRRLVRDFVSVP